MKQFIKNFLPLFTLGLVGVLSLALMEFPLESLPEIAQQEILKIFTRNQLRFLTLINPTIYLIISVTIGTLLFEKVNLNSAILNHLNKIKRINSSEIVEIFKWGLAGGILGCSIIALSSFLIKNVDELNILAELDYELPVLTRLLYGGITEELICRWGIMVFLVYVFGKFIKGNNSPYYMGILISSFLFAIAHLPMAFTLLSSDINATIIIYLIGVNLLAGIVYGYIFWKKNIEAAMIAHIFTHVFLILIGM